MEKILGSFEARQGNTWTADVQYRVFVSSDRAVAVRTGGQLAGQSRQLLAHQLGLIGILVHKLFLEKREARRKAEQVKALELCTMTELLARHAKNFELPFHAIKRARIDRQRLSMHGPSVARLVLEPQSREPVKLLLQNREQLDACRALLAGALDGRLTLDPKLPGSPPAERRAKTG
ncbi:MAG TPA: hypothetical protein VF912_09650 [Anaeromyxobacter sp.]